MDNTTVISSPGKVLAAGGYLVLDPAYSGVVISTSSRFYSVIEHRGSSNRIHVRSPQFIEAAWYYSVELKDRSVKIEQIAGG
jgi:phosphomevalonate kinase